MSEEAKRVRIVESNVRGLKNKELYVKQFIKRLKDKPDVFCVVEHNLRNPELLQSFDGYRIGDFHCRPNQGGGVALLVREQIKDCKSLQTLYKDEFDEAIHVGLEIAGVKLILDDKSDPLLVIGVYRRVRLCNDAAFCETLSKILEKAKNEKLGTVVITGDFNFDNTKKSQSLKRTQEIKATFKKLNYKFTHSAASHEKGACLNNFLVPTSLSCTKRPVDKGIVIPKEDHIKAQPSDHKTIQLIVTLQANSCAITQDYSPGHYSRGSHDFDAHYDNGAQIPHRPSSLGVNQESIQDRVPQNQTQRTDFHDSRRHYVDGNEIGRIRHQDVNRNEFDLRRNESYSGLRNGGSKYSDGYYNNDFEAYDRRDRSRSSTREMDDIRRGDDGYWSQNNSTRTDPYYSGEYNNSTRADPYYSGEYRNNYYRTRDENYNSRYYNKTIQTDDGSRYENGYWTKSSTDPNQSATIDDNSAGYSYSSRDRISQRPDWSRDRYQNDRRRDRMTEDSRRSGPVSSAIRRQDEGDYIHISNMSSRIVYQHEQESSSPISRYTTQETCEGWAAIVGSDLLTPSRHALPVKRPYESTQQNTTSSGDNNDESRDYKKTRHSDTGRGIDSESELSTEQQRVLHLFNTKWPVVSSKVFTDKFCLDIFEKSFDSDKWEIHQTLIKQMTNDELYQLVRNIFMVLESRERPH